MFEENQIQTNETIINQTNFPKEFSKDNIRLNLQQLFINKEISLIYSNIEEPSKFSAGVIGELYENELVLESYLPNGKYDGYVVIPISDIFKVEFKTKYAKKISDLGIFYKTSHQLLNQKKENGYLDLLNYAYCENKIISIELNYSGVTDAQGFVREIKQNACAIDMLDEYGNNDGISIIKLDEISHLTCDGDTEICLKILSST